MQYPHSAASKGSKTRDLPPVSGSIIWARQIDQQLTMYLKRVEDVLGEWLLVVTCGYWWLLVVTSGYLWLLVVTCGYLWLLVVTNNHELLLSQI